jgi:DNA-binding LacI/PurR family transcriptional regulator
MVMGISTTAPTGSEKEIVNQIASRLRAKIRDVSNSFIPNPGVYLSKTTYAIHVRQDPPAGWKQTVGPSIGLLLSDPADWFAGKLIQGVVEVSDSHDYDLIVDVSKDDPIIEARKLQHLLERTLGVLIVPASNTVLDPALKRLLQSHECVLVDRYFHDLPGVLCVHHDDVSAGRQAALYLKECACARVLIVDQASRSSDRFAITALEDRAKGCRVELGDEIRFRYLPAAGSDEQGGFVALEQFEKKEPLAPNDGIFALTDKLALGCRHYLATRQPPLDLPLIGAEGQPFGDFLTPPFASIEFDIVELGGQAAKVLFAKMQEGDLPRSDCQPHFLTTPTLLKPSLVTGKRERVSICFPDAASYYSETKSR